VTVTAPPRPPATGDLVDWGDPEALIAEARQRARRRRRRYAAIVAVLALLVSSVLVVFGRPEPPQSLSPEPPRTLPIPPDPGDAATIVALFAKFQAGWVLVYGDGRVIRHSDLVSGGSGDMFERRLTATGLDLVRSGAIGLGAILRTAPLPADTWADPEFKPYVPSRYAACLDPGNPDGFLGIRPGHATAILGRLPAAAQPLLRGKEHTYSSVLFSPSGPPVECFEVSTAEALVFFKTLLRAGFAFKAWVDGDGESHSWNGWSGVTPGPCGALEQPAAIGVCLMPILPHGEWVAWGG
jgi:hypothetical protein